MGRWPSVATPDDGACDGPADEGSFLKVALGLFITMGLLISYAPQIIKSKSSLGISVWFLLLGSLGGGATIGNIAIMQSTAVMCCFTKHSEFQGLSEPHAQHRLATWKEAVQILNVIFAWLTLVALAVVVALFIGGNFALGVATLFGFIGVGTSLVQFLPQIWTTYIIKPGTNWTSWIAFLAAGILQGVLLLMCLYFKYYHHPTPGGAFQTLGRVVESEGAGATSERAPLLSPRTLPIQEDVEP
ncbi:hypothetical protein HK405_012842 [Cladochytrium tenue]|nr:hypothetical protein HK405_012842 [Cladochytrium tenue]